VADEAEGRPIAQDAYDALAESYADLIDTKPHNAYYERPATLSLLPDVAGKRVLDAGCGPGVYSELLLAREAEVVAFDANETMVRLARERLDGNAEVVVADLGKPLGFLEDSSFDLVLCTLALDYVRDWAPVFCEFARVLREEGVLLFSIGHPFADYFLRDGAGHYFETELVEYDWTGFGGCVRVPSYRRPLGEVITPLLEAGFVLERLLEPIPTEEFKVSDPVEYEELSRRPGFLCIRARKE